MKLIPPIVTGAAVIAVAAAARRTWRRGRGRWPTGRPAREPQQRWHSVTVNRAPLDQAPQGYAIFQAKLDGCVRSVFRP